MKIDVFRRLIEGETDSRIFTRQTRCNLLNRGDIENFRAQDQSESYSLKGNAYQRVKLFKSKKKHPFETLSREACFLLSLDCGQHFKNVVFVKTELSWSVSQV